MNDSKEETLWLVSHCKALPGKSSMFSFLYHMTRIKNMILDARPSILDTQRAWHAMPLQKYILLVKSWTI